MMLNYYNLDYYTVPGNAAFRHWISLHPGKLDWVSSLSSMFIRKRDQIWHWNASCLKPLVLPQAQDDLEAIYVVYFVKTNLSKRRNSVLWTRDKQHEFLNLFYKNRRIRCKCSFQRHHGDSWKSLEDLRFWKLMNLAYPRMQVLHKLQLY